MSTHTPGPWPKPERWIEYLIQENERLADLNADLLAVLKSLVVNDGRISGVNLGALKPAVERAIAKAEAVS